MYPNLNTIHAISGQLAEWEKDMAEDTEGMKKGETIESQIEIAEEEMKKGENIESQIETAMRSRVSHFKEQSE